MKPGTLWGQHRTSELIGRMLGEIVESHGLTPKVIYARPKENARIKMVDLENVVVELMTPEPEKLMLPLSPEVRWMLEEFDPVPFTHFYRVADTANPLYQETVEKYAGVMKDVLLNVKNLKLATPL